MKRLFLTVILTVATATAALADPIEGRWRTAGDDNGNSGLIEVAPCADGYCGTLIVAYGPDGSQISSDNVGRQILIGMEIHSSGEYRGQVYSPDRGQTYNSRVTIFGNTLSVRGCRLGICRDGGTWTRVN